jgi:hypothetical protein
VSHGLGDPLKAGVDALEGKLPSFKIVVIKEADHMTAPGKPEFIGELKKFLAANSGASASARPLIRKGLATAPSAN